MIETRANFGFMLAGLVMLWSVEPFMIVVGTGTALIAMYVVIAAALCLGAWSLARERRVFVTAASLALLALIAAITAFVTGNVLAQFLTVILQIAFWAMCAWVVVRDVLAEGPADTNRIAGAICIYLIAAVIWALLYVLINQIDPASFKGLAAVPFEAQFAELMYFSTVTLTTLGYGDVTPVNPYVRWLAQIQAVFGQFYIAILVATLVGIRIAGATSIGGDGNR